MSAQQESLENKKSVPLVAWSCAGVTIVSLWFMVVLAGIVAPDFVSGSQQEHLKLVGGVDWIWGLVASSFVVLAVLHGIRLGVENPTPWRVLGGGVASVWLGVLAVTACAPVMVTGTDPTRIPLTALGVPILGVFLTWFVCTLVRTAFDQESMESSWGSPR